jgi:hypothetical protein
MSPRVIPVGHLDEDGVRSALRAATAVPALGDGRPWEFHCTAATIELHVDSRLDDRYLVISCGAALLNLRLAIRALGIHPAFQLFPDPHRPNLLAVVRPRGHVAVDPVDRELAGAIFRRGTDHGPFLDTTVSLPVVAGLREAAKTELAWLPTLTAAHLAILRGLVDQAQDVHPLIAVVGTFHDSPLARLRAGQAMQRVLLVAAVAGLSASFLSQVVAVSTTRQRLRELVVGGLWPQVVLRLGYCAPLPVVARPVPELGGQDGGLGAPLHTELGEQA